MVGQPPHYNQTCFPSSQKLFSQQTSARGHGLHPCARARSGVDRSVRWRHTKAGQSAIGDGRGGLVHSPQNRMQLLSSKQGNIMQSSLEGDERIPQQDASGTPTSNTTLDCSTITFTLKICLDKGVLCGYVALHHVFRYIQKRGVRVPVKNKVHVLPGDSPDSSLFPRSRYVSTDSFPSSGGMGPAVEMLGQGRLRRAQIIRKF